jgi:signal transduction histidine kinase
MKVNKQSHTPSSSDGRIDPTDNLSAMTERVAGCIRNFIPHPIAIFVPGDVPRTYSPGDFPAKHLREIRIRFESNAQLLTDLQQTSGRLIDPHRFSDGSFAFLLPLIHDGALEAVLCLYGKSTGERELLQQQLISLEPICQLTALFISRTRGSQGEAGGIQSQVSGASEENPKAMSRLVYGLLRTISHDIRTPITTVRGFVKMLLDGRTGPISDPQRECLQMAFQGVDHLIRIGTSVSDAAGHIEQIHAEILDVPVLWQAVMEASRPLLRAKSVTIEENIEGDVRSVCGDRQSLTNLFKQIVACVIRAVEQRGTLRIDLRCRNEVTLMLTFPEIPGTLALPGADEELAPAREIAFLHGGKITLRPGKEGSSILMLALPGYNE